MIAPQDFVRHLGSQGFHFFAGVPCSYFTSVIQHLKHHKTSSYQMAANEGTALALAAGASLGGIPASVLIQNSGLGNLINPLTSLHMIYQIPALIFVSGRAYGIPDEPQHEVMGRSMGKLLDAVGISYWDLPSNGGWEEILDQGICEARNRKIPVVFFVRQATFETSITEESAAKYPMKRSEAIRIISEACGKGDMIFSTTGKISRELFAFGDRPGNFYMQGSMGHIGAVALGTAMVHSRARTVVLDGDGALLMHLGIMAMIGHYRPRNFCHVVLDNEAYETTGNQDTFSSSVDLAQVAIACGYQSTAKAANPEELRDSLKRLTKETGPVFLHVKVNRLETKDIPRITTRYTAAQITDSFQRFISEGLAAVPVKPVNV